MSIDSADSSSQPLFNEPICSCLLFLSPWSVAAGCPLERHESPPFSRHLINHCSQQPQSASRYWAAWIASLSVHTLLVNMHVQFFTELFNTVVHCAVESVTDCGFIQYNIELLLGIWGVLICLFAFCEFCVCSDCRKHLQKRRSPLEKVVFSERSHLPGQKI